LSGPRKRRSKNEGPIFGPLVFNAYKPVGMTSSDVVRHFKYHLPKGYGKIGHFGTLDPFAEGVLLIAIGQAPRFNDYVHSHYPKTYVATGVLGIESPTGDFTVEEDQLKNHDVPELSKDDLTKVIETFKGEYMQSPAAFSASKHEGKTLYEWARKGVIIEKPPVKREIIDIELIDFVDGVVKFRSTVSSGTYIRVLFDDIAKKLGTRGTLKELVRESIGPANIDNALLKEQWPLRESDFNVYENSFSISDFINFPKVSLNEEEGLKFGNGMPLRKELADGFYWAFSGEVLRGLSQIESSELRVRVGLSTNLIKKN
jgi:tRNA pseudouridine55 synthase